MDFILSSKKNPPDKSGGLDQIGGRIGWSAIVEVCATSADAFELSAPFDEDKKTSKESENNRITAFFIAFPPHVFYLNNLLIPDTFPAANRNQKSFCKNGSDRYGAHWSLQDMV